MSVFVIEFNVQCVVLDVCEVMFVDFGFGWVFIDYMVMICFIEGCGWYDLKIIVCGFILMDFVIVVFYYVQEIFEGMKVYCYFDGLIVLF